MGTIRHDAIVVTSNEENTHKAHAKAIELGLLVTNFCNTNMNGYSSFLVCPDGSKEGFDVSKAKWIKHEMNSRLGWMIFA